MKVVRENINEKFTEKSDPIEDMRIGLDAKLKELQNSSAYLRDDDFKDDEFIIYLFKNEYDKWKKKIGSIKPDDIEIWEDTTYGGNSIVKIKAPGVRETTLIRGESEYSLVSKDIIKLLNSPKIKDKLAKKFNKRTENPYELTNMIFTSGRRKKLTWSSIMVADKIAKRLIKIFE